MFGRRLAALVGLFGVLVAAQDVTVEGFGGGKEVDIKQLNATLLALDKIAKANGGNRAFGLPGFDASVDFILGSIHKFDTQKAFKVWTQPFIALWTQVTVHTLEIPATGESFSINPLTYSPSTPEGGITEEVAIVPGSITPCTAEELLATGEDFTGKILLIERGLCPDGTTFAGKVKVAQGVGAVSALIYNSVDAYIGSGTLTAPNPLYVPSGILQRDVGLALRERVLAGEDLVVRYEQIQIIENRTTTNIFAETKAGDKQNVIQLGGHLDSVQAGAGINDDGSGSSLVLELLRTLDAKHVKNKVRFSWWGAEENGLLGSKYFTGNLGQADADNILAYLNFDMVGRGYYGVFDGDGSAFGLVPPAGSEVIESIFQKWFASQGIEITEAALTNGSDYRYFWEYLHKPIGGLHTGTAAAQDPCYHQGCDDFNNVNKTQLWINTRAAKYVLDTLVKDGTTLLPKSPSNWTSTTVLSKVVGIEWTEIEGEGHTCAEEV